MSSGGGTIVVQASGDLWVYATDRKTFTRLTLQTTIGNSFTTWTPDGERVIFRTNSGLYSIPVDGSGKSELIPSTSIGDFPTCVTPDGATLLTNRQTPAVSQDVYAVSLKGDSPPKAIISTPAFEGGAELSADGRWLAYVSDEAGQMQVYIRPYPALDKRWQVSTEGGTSPVWNRNGRELFYRSGNKMMAVDVVPDTLRSDLRLSPPRMLFDQNLAYGQTISLPNYDVSADGQRFLMIQDEPGSSRLNIILNWNEELKRIASGK